MRERCAKKTQKQRKMKRRLQTPWHIRHGSPVATASVRIYAANPISPSTWYTAAVGIRTSHGRSRVFRVQREKERCLPPKVYHLDDQVFSDGDRMSSVSIRHFFLLRHEPLIRQGQLFENLSLVHSGCQAAVHKSSKLHGKTQARHNNPVVIFQFYHGSYDERC